MDIDPEAYFDDDSDIPTPYAPPVTAWQYYDKLNAKKEKVEGKSKAGDISGRTGQGMDREKETKSIDDLLSDRYYEMNRSSEMVGMVPNNKNKEEEESDDVELFHGDDLLIVDNTSTQDQIKTRNRRARRYVVTHCIALPICTDALLLMDAFPFPYMYT